jgi:hypothetical protein
LSFPAGKAGRFSTGVTAITLAACATKAPAPITKDSPENQATLRKLEGYIVCLGEAHHNLEVADRYRERYATHPPSATDDTPVQPATDPERCDDSVLASVPLEPRLPEIDIAALDYLDAETETYALTVTMHTAFDHDGPLYNPAAGIALHPRLLAAFDRFDAAQATLFDRVFALNHKIHIDQLARRTKQEGRTFPVMLEDMILRAETVIPYASVSSDRLDAIDVAGMTAAIAGLQSAVDEVTAYTELNPKDPVVLAPGFWHVPIDAKQYVAAARQLAVRARDHVAYTDAEKVQIAAHNEAAVVGTPAAMIEAYNQLLDVYTPSGSWPR